MNPKPLGLVVCMPTRGAVVIETMLCLREHLDGYPRGDRDDYPGGRFAKALI
jgi:hypothetical protein